MVKPIRLIKRSIFRIIETILAFFIVTFSLFVWYVSQNPVDLKFLIPTFQQTIQKDNPNLSFESEKFYLITAFHKKKIFEIRMENARFFKKDTEVINVPSGSFSFSFLDLIRGKLYPNEVYFDQPEIFIDLDEVDEEASSYTGKDGQRDYQRVKKIFRKISELDKWVIENGTFKLKKEDKEFTVQNINVLIDRQFSNINFNLRGQSQIGKYLVPIEFNGQYKGISKLLDLTLNIKEVDISQFGVFMSMLQGLETVVDLNMNLRLNLNEGNIEKSVLGGDFTIHSAKNMTLYLPAPLDTSYYLKSVDIKGQISKNFEHIIIPDIDAALGNASLTVDISMLNVGTFDADKIKTTLNAKILDIPMSKVPDIWPSSLGENAHAWVKKNVVGGNVDQALFTLKFNGPSLDSVKGVLDVKGTTIRYMSDLPKIDDVDAKVILQLGQVDIFADKGHTGSIQLQNAEIHLTDLLSDVNWANVKIKAQSPINEVMDLISLPSLELTENLDFDVKKITGESEIDMILDFILGGKKEDVKLKLNADLSDVSIPITSGILFSDGVFKLEIENGIMNLNGNGQIDNILMDVSMKQNFSLSSKIKSSYDLKARILSEKIKLKYPVLSQYFNGEITASTQIEFWDNGLQPVKIYSVLDNAQISFPVISYNKKMSVPAVLNMQIDSENGQIKVSDFNFFVPSEKTSIVGNAVIGKDYRINLSQILTPDNDAKAELYLNDNQTDISVSGNKMDLRPLMKDDTTSNEKRKNLKIKADLKKIKLSDLDWIQNLQFEMDRKDGLYQKLFVNFDYPEKAFIQLKEDNKIHVRVPDVGRFLAITGYTDRISGGRINNQFIQDNQGIEGTIQISPFALNQTSFLTRAMTIFGILNTQKEISFDKAKISFRLSRDGVLTIDDAIASGTALGLLIRGTVGHGNIDLKGSVVPAYGINSLPGKIPLIGKLLTGGEGGGIFGVSFTVEGTTDNPDVNFNPSSLLTPGFLQKIWN